MEVACVCISCQWPPRAITDSHCTGWQIFPWLNGWMYKNTASNGGLFHLGARLAMYTKNDTYAKWAEKAYDWMAQSPILPGNGTVMDGTNIASNPPCSKADPTQWTYNYGIMIAGAAYVSLIWSARRKQLLTHSDVQLHQRGREMENRPDPIHLQI